MIDCLHGDSLSDEKIEDVLAGLHDLRAKKLHPAEIQAIDEYIADIKERSDVIRYDHEALRLIVRNPTKGRI